MIRCMGRALALASLVAGCAISKPPSSLATAEELQEFRAQMLADAAHVSDYLTQTERGTNLSEFKLGWFVYDVLIEVSNQDDDLYAFFSKGGHDIEDYMKTTFHDQPEREIASLDDMAKHGHRARRQTARYALEALRHIPNDNDPPAAQAEDRAALIAALRQLKILLEQDSALVEVP